MADLSSSDHERDAGLVRRALAGDERAFADLVQRYIRRALAVAWEFSGTREDAEDIVQEAFLRTVRALERYDPARPFSAWFFTIVRNTARNAAASRQLHVMRFATPLGRVAELRAQDAGASAASADGELMRGELRERMEQAMEALPPMQRSCFRLSEAEGFTRAEVADMLGISEATVRVHVHRARKALRLALEPLRNDIGAT